MKIKLLIALALGSPSLMASDEERANALRSFVKAKLATSTRNIYSAGFEKSSAVEKAYALAEQYPTMALQYLRMSQTSQNQIENSIARAAIISNLAVEKRLVENSIETLEKLDDNDLDKQQILKKYQLLVDLYFLTKDWKNLELAYTNYANKFKYHELNETSLIRAALALLNNKNYEQADTILEKMAQYHPSTSGSNWAFNLLYKRSQTRDRQGKRLYYFPVQILRKINRYSYLKIGLRDQVLNLVNGPIKMNSGRIRVLEGASKIRTIGYIREPSLALDMISEAYQKKDLMVESERRELKWLEIKLQMRLQKYDLAEQNINKYLANISNNSQFVAASRNMGRIMLNRHRLKEATKHLKLVAYKTKAPKDRWAYFWTLFKNKNYKKALKYYNKPNYIQNNDFNRFPSGKKYWLSRLMDENKKRTSAANIREEIVTRNPTSYYSFLIQEANQKEWDKYIIANKLFDRSRLIAMESTQESLQFLAAEDPRFQRFPLNFNTSVSEVSKILGIEPYLILSIMKAESGFRPSVISPVGARGLMQMMPATASRLSKKLNLSGIKPTDLNKPDIAIAYGAYYLDYLLDIYNGNYLAVIAAYNAGPKKVNQWLNICNGCKADEFIETISYKETRHYVKKVFAFIKNYRSLYNPLADRKISKTFIPYPPTQTSELF